jgi:Fe-S-cluster-containing hydrogenase component 2
MKKEMIRYACPYCDQELDKRSSLKTHLEMAHPAAQVWGREIYPLPKGEAFIDADVMKCTGCGLCAEACSMHHFGVINKDFTRIYVRNFLLPLPKAIIVTCSQCQEEERLCEKACPVSPPAIYFDKHSLHMVVDTDRCTGCLSCRDACATEAIRFKPLICDLCDKENRGDRDPQCVKICPATALYYHNRVERIRPLRDSSRKSSDEKANMVARRLYPLTRDSIAYPPWRP